MVCRSGRSYRLLIRKSRGSLDETFVTSLVAEFLCIEIGKQARDFARVSQQVPLISALSSCQCVLKD